MRITMVTISFNQAPYLKNCIESILAQSYLNVEYIIVDAGSTDGSRELISSYDDRVTRKIFEPDFGPPDGLNKGFANATGDIYGFLNSDDVLEPGALDDVVDYFKKNPGVDVVSGSSWIIDSNGLKLRKFFSDRYCLWMAARGASILSQSSTFFRASAFQKTAGFNVRNVIAWDGELFVDMALNGAKFSYVDRIWSQFRIHEQGITGSGKFDKENTLYFNYIFKKIVGREKKYADKPIDFMVKNLRKILNPRDTFERIFRGPIYHRKF